MITLKNKLCARGFLRALLGSLLFSAVAVPAQPSVDAASIEKVEYFWSKPAGKGPFPLVVLIHGHQEGPESRLGGRAFANWGVLQALADGGAVAVAVSRPGYGETEGDRDFCGPRSQAAVKTVLDHFRAKPFVDTKRVALQGISCGAAVAGRLATRDRSIAAVVLIAGLYDFKSAFESRCGRVGGYFDSLCWTMRLEMPLDEVGFANRSTLGNERSIGAAVLILHGENDPRCPVSQARSLESALKNQGKTVEMTVFSRAGHHVPIADRAPIIDRFLERYIGVRQRAE